MTQNEQKQQLCVAYVHAVAARAGYTCQVQTVDEDSVDVLIGARGYAHHQAVVRSPRIEVQLKATSALRLGPKHLSFPLKPKNYDELRAFPDPAPLAGAPPPQELGGVDRDQRGMYDQ